LIWNVVLDAAEIWTLTQTDRRLETFVMWKWISYAVFIYYFNCISFAIWLSGRKVAIKLIDRLID